MDKVCSLRMLHGTEIVAPPLSTDSGKTAEKYFMGNTEISLLITNSKGVPKEHSAKNQ